MGHSQGWGGGGHTGGSEQMIVGAHCHSRRRNVLYSCIKLNNLHLSRNQVSLNHLLDRMWSGEAAYDELKLVFKNIIQIDRLFCVPQINFKNNQTKHEFPILGFASVVFRKSSFAWKTMGPKMKTCDIRKLVGGHIVFLALRTAGNQRRLKVTG